MLRMQSRVAGISIHYFFFFFFFSVAWNIHTILLSDWRRENKEFVMLHYVPSIRNADI